MKVNIGKGLKRAIIIIYVLLLLLHLFMLYLGLASVLTTLLFYISAALIAGKSLQILSKKIPFFRNYKTNLLLLAASVCVTLFTCELFLKYYIKKHLSYGENNGSFYYTSPYREYLFHNFKRKYIIKQDNCWLKTNAPNSQKIDKTPEFSYTHKYNSEGLRDKDLPKTRSMNEYRIIGLGSSFTEGNGAHQDSTWLKFLEYDLTKQFSNKTISTLNAGIAGSDPLFGYVLLIQRLLILKPNLVTMTIGAHDIQDLIIRGGKERFLADKTVRYRDAPNWEFLYAFSFIFRHFIHNALNLNWTLMSPGDYEIQKAKALDLIYSSILELNKLSKENNFELMVIFHPIEQDFITEHFALNDLATKISSQTEIHILNLYKYYISKGMSKNNLSEYYWRLNLHHNKKGYQLWAKAVSQKLNQLDWIK